MRFPIVIHKDEDSSFGVTVPDLPGCFSADETLEGAIDRAHEAIMFHIEGLLMQGAAIPERAPLEVHQADKHFADGIFAIVAVDLSKMDSKAKRINITVPSRVLAIIDSAASREGESRSGLIARATLSYLERRAKEQLAGSFSQRSVRSPGSPPPRISGEIQCVIVHRAREPSCIQAPRRCQ